MRRPRYVLRWPAVLMLAWLILAPTQFHPAFAQEQCSPLITIDAPAPGGVLQGSVTFSGWAVDQRSQNGSGIESVQIVRDGLLGAGGVTLGTAVPVPRPDVAAALGTTDNLGYALTADVSGLTPGTHTFYIYATTS